jgi:predicted MFS family arabinose efflux permease
MYGIGGVTGALIGGEITNNLDPYYAFYIIALAGIIICFLGVRLNRSVENINAEFITMSFASRSKMVLREVWKGLQL